MDILIISVLSGAAGYWINRYQLASKLSWWAEDQHRGTRGFWPAQVILTVALAWVWITHPRRCLANRRAWLEAHPSPGIWRGQYVHEDV